MNLNSFWKQPAKGIKEETRGRTEQEICIREEQIGFKFPSTYRDLMKLQNGGYIRKRAFYQDGECKELFYNGAIIDKISSIVAGYQTMFDVLSEWKEEDEINSLSTTEYNYLHRLPIISHMDGHEWMCFDYGWTEKDEKIEPHVVFFNDRFEERLRIQNFNDLVKGLVYYGYESCEYYFAIKTQKSLNYIAQKLNRELSLELEEKIDDRHGWFNYAKYYSGDLKVEDNFRLQFTLSPNKFRSNTYLFQEHPNLNTILGIIPIIGKFETISVNSKYFKNVMVNILDRLDGIEFMELLIPENVIA